MLQNEFGTLVWVELISVCWQFKKSNKEGNSKTNDIMQESMYLCLDTED